MEKVYLLKLIKVLDDEDGTYAISTLGGIYAEQELADEDGTKFCDVQGYDDYIIEEWDLLSAGGTVNPLLQINSLNGNEYIQ